MPPIFRFDVSMSDRDEVRRLVESTGFFHLYETDVAVELVDERLAKGPASGYHFVFLEEAGRVAGYTCYGPIACTESSYDLYWIVVDRAFQGRGFGRLLLAETERRIAEQGGVRVYAETSGRPQYQSTRDFYEHFGYRKEAELTDFYAPGDAKVVYVKVVRGG